jgi:hypothetical protein
VASDAGVALKLHPNAIQAILAIENPLTASRPMNSRMARGVDAPLDKALEKVQKGSVIMTKSQLLEQSWEPQVAAYVQDLALKKLI